VSGGHLGDGESGDGRKLHFCDRAVMNELGEVKRMEDRLSEGRE
jgi:hypothetical protein